MTQEQVDYIVKHKAKDDWLYVVNNAFQLVDSATAIYAADLKFWREYYQDIIQKDIGRRYIAQEPEPQDTLEGVEYVEGVAGVGLGREIMHYGGNSGYQAINKAWLDGATKIVLLGYNMKRKGKTSHFFQEQGQSRPSHLQCTSPYHEWLKKFSALAYDLKEEGVEVMNCTIDSAIEDFEKGTIEQGVLF